MITSSISKKRAQKKFYRGDFEKKKLFCPMDENYIDKVNQASEVSNFVNLPMILIDDVHGDISEEERIKKIM